MMVAILVVVVLILLLLLPIAAAVGKCTYQDINGKWYVRTGSELEEWRERR
jgi:hypothetical protein